jgi:tRNA1(Val) A37 N6-methylase TrmN6
VSAEEFFPDGLTTSRFLGGALIVRQPVRGYRAGVDPVLLAAACPARAGQSVLELGCGAGVASLCLGRRVPGLRMAGIEIQPGYAELARDNAAANDVPLEVHEGDLAEMPVALRTRNFDHVILNPPFFDRAEGSAAPDAGRETARGETLGLGDWLRIAGKRLRPKGQVTVIHRATRLADLLDGLRAADLGAVRLLPISPRAGRDAHLLLARATRQGKAPLVLHAPSVMHNGPAHRGDREDYTPAFSAVLRDGAALAFPGDDPAD